MNCSGDGQPTVLLDAPTGKSSDSWLKVQPLLSKFTTVCIYDRAGLGFSQRPMENWSHGNEESMKYERKRGQPFTAERMVDDFHQLFTVSSSRMKPFILVGAGLGAVNVKFYSYIYDRDVAGVILINPLVESLFSEENTVWRDYWYGRVVSSLQLLQLCAAIGLNRIALILGLMKIPFVFEDMTEIQLARQKFLSCRPAHLSSSVDEHYFANISLAQLRTMGRLKPFPRIPVSIITSTYYDRKLSQHINKLWMEQQEHIVSHFPGISSQTWVDCGEEELFTRHYNRIVQSVQEMVINWREKQR